MVSVDTVSALAPHIAIDQAPAVPGTPPGINDPYNKPQIRKITVPQVEKFIADVTSMVDLRLFRRWRVRNVRFMQSVDKAAMDIIANGAGSYLVAAAFPTKSGINENTAYSAELWRRYKEALDALDKLLGDYLGAGGPDVEPDPAAGGIVFSSFPKSKFPDDMRF